MEPYKEMYLSLFNAVTNAIEYLESRKYDLALWTLERAQQKSEERYMKEGEPEEV